MLIASELLHVTPRAVVMRKIQRGKPISASATLVRSVVSDLPLWGTHERVPLYFGRTRDMYEPWPVVRGGQLFNRYGARPLRRPFRSMGTKHLQRYYEHVEACAVHCLNVGENARADEWFCRAAAARDELARRSA